MAIKPAELFPAQTTPGNAQYPLGSAQNVSSANENDGTPLSASWLNDCWGFFQKTLVDGAVTASGTPDDATNSQYLLALKNIMSRSTPVGSIIFSMLDETTFNTEIALGTWVKLDGRDVTGSNYSSIIGQNNVPDLQGKFIRAAGGASDAIATEQSDATGYNGLGINWDSSNVNTNTTTIAWSSANASTNNDSHNHTRGSWQVYGEVYKVAETFNNNGTCSGNFGKYTGYSASDTPAKTDTSNAGRFNSVGSRSFTGSTNTDTHNHTLNKNQWNSNQNSHGHYVNKNALDTNQNWDGDAETRPVNISFHGYIKINY